MQRTWPTQTAIYNTFPNTLCQKNRQTLKTVIDAFNFVYYSFFSFHEASCNICGWPQITFSLCLHILDTPNKQENTEHGISASLSPLHTASTENFLLAPCGTLTSCWNLLHQKNGLYYTRDHFVSANLLGWQKPTEFSTFHQSCQQFPGFGRLTNKILLVKAEILSPGPVAASLPHRENRSQLSTSDHCLKGHLKAYIWGNFFLQSEHLILLISNPFWKRNKFMAKSFQIKLLYYFIY